jgi:fructose-1,6-bisphosphatase/sedoheptulose 1,7-bisphosphatase-like protein
MQTDLPPDPDRDLALELVRATEAAAIAAARFMGRGMARSNLIRPA